MPPSSDDFAVRDIPGAGRGVIALRNLSSGSPILSTSNLAAHVVFREYRKEVCAQCFHYDRGRTLPVRAPSTGKVLCTQECQDEWAREHGNVGVEAWESLEAWVKARSSAVQCTATTQSAGERPTVEQIEAAWLEVDAARIGKVDESKEDTKQRRKYLQSINTGPVDPDILSYLLSGVLSASKQLDVFPADVSSLALDSTPYRSPSDLAAHILAFRQLASLIPRALLQHCTTSTAQTLISAASHNSFGIRAGSEEDMEEYIGYALYPDASYFNHSCQPNVGKKRRGRAWEFWVSREVKEGEELCISYLGGDEKGLDVRGRRERLRGTWGFECACGRCVREAAGGDEM